MLMKVGAGPRGLTAGVLENEDEDLRWRAECDAVKSCISQHFLAISPGYPFVLKKYTTCLKSFGQI